MSRHNAENNRMRHSRDKNDYFKKMIIKYKKIHDTLLGTPANTVLDLILPSELLFS